MCSLDNLPAELILHCCSFLDACSLFKLCLVSHSLHPYAEQILYREFPAEPKIWQAFWMFLLTILRRSDLAHHVRKLTLPPEAFRHSGKRSLPSGFQRLPRYKKNGQPNLITLDPTTRWFVLSDEILQVDVGRENTALVIQSADRLGLTKKTSWLQYVASGSPEPFTFLLVYNLPNLEIIKTHLPLPPRFYWNFYHGPSMDSSSASLSFKRLREFSAFPSLGSICELSFTEIKQILSIPRITRLEATLGKPPFYSVVTLHDPLSEPTYFGEIEERSSNVEHLSLANIDHQQVMITLVRAPRALKSFQYQYPALERIEYTLAPFFDESVRRSPEGYGFSPRALGAVLKHHVDSLEKLDLTIDRRPPHFGSEPPDFHEPRGHILIQIDLNSQYDISAPKFQRLKHLVIDIRFLLGLDWGTRCGESGSVVLEEVTRSVPESVDTLELQAMCDEPGLKSFLNAVATEMPLRQGVFRHVDRLSTTARMVAARGVLFGLDFELCARTLDPVQLSQLFFTQVNCDRSMRGWERFLGKFDPGLSPGQVLQENLRRALTFGKPVPFAITFPDQDTLGISDIRFRLAMSTCP